KVGLSAVVGATGIVYGDIGTSPLYAFEKSVDATGGYDPANILGLLSLIFWSLIISVTLKYIVIMMRADNDGEGGVLALLALAQRRLMGPGRGVQFLVGCALAGSALFFCDSMITPAISVLSAVEGVELIKPDLAPAVIPITLAVLAILFSVQRRGTAIVAKLFGPIMVVWFLSLGIAGAISIARAPQVLSALNPAHGIILLATHPAQALAIIGAVFLALTGGEALYADMGHFGKTPVRIAWFVLVLPALLLNYYGQGAMFLSVGASVPRPLFTMVPPSYLAFMVILATAATVIASQAVISGAFSVARQAVQLDLLPRLRILQTSAEEQGQIYVPVVNGVLFIAVVAFVLTFQTSDALSAAYGAAVIGTMAMTTVLGAYVAWTQWNWNKPFVVALFGLLLAMDLTFLVGNLTKVSDGGWIPLTMAAFLFMVFYTWRMGRAELRSALAEMAVPITRVDTLLQGVQRVPGTGVFLASDPDVVPSALIRNLEHNHVAHERILILNIDIVRTPRRDPAHRVSVEELMPQVYRLTAHFGFMETPDVGIALRSARARGLRVFMEDCSFFVGQHVVRARPLPGWRGLQRKFFARMQRRSAQAAEFFRMPGRGLVILTTAVEV
ncbi:MAG TPA: KUP/HAK/KT family potassium transporter, partial [Steroidobacteraceae bacterium]|nr:KUP/HAK/KT family potassium transporter [Steroidobacteraceae bacterium]